MSKEDKKPRNALVALPREDPKPEVPARDPMDVVIAKLVLAAGPSAHTSLIRGSARVKKITASNYGLIVVQELEPGKDDTWFTPWSNVIWLRHG